ncbi:unnamed protein product [Allacma fusca]|uniref:Uncharacterized protein n=1 Tax=Allacma fusca TaxID=39272 RepID=A0A8J2K911_9HEXA|nr:unnamed protein product [Allacma fusca]
MADVEDKGYFKGKDTAVAFYIANEHCFWSSTAAFELGYRCLGEPLAQATHGVYCLDTFMMKYSKHLL